MSEIQFDKDTFLIPPVDGLSLCGHKLKCKLCSRKILVQMVLFGNPHHLDLVVTCSDCLKIDQNFSNMYPELAKNLEEWKNGG